MFDCIKTCSDARECKIIEEKFVSIILFSVTEISQERHIHSMTSFRHHSFTFTLVHATNADVRF